jgi:YHS domain-containing protein
MGREAGKSGGMSKLHTTEGMPIYDTLTGRTFYYCHEAHDGDFAQDPDRYRLATVQEQATIRLIYNPQPLTMEWTLFDPSRGYQKAMQDIMLASGEVVIKCWPNAMMWCRCGDKGLDIPIRDAVKVRLTHDEKWNA